MNNWYNRYLKLQKTVFKTRNLWSFVKIIVLFGLIIAAIAETLMKEKPVLAWALILIAASTGIALLFVSLRHDLKNRKQFDQYWDDQLKASEDRNSSKN